MKLGTKVSEDQKKIAAVVVFVVIASVLVYFEYFYTGTPTAQAPAAVASAPANSAGDAAATGSSGGNAARAVGKSSTALDPTLHMEAMLVSESVEYSGTGRNIFSASSVPVGPIPEAIAAARPKTAVVTPPPPVQPAVPAPPPPIPLKFFGYETSKGARQAFLLHGDDVILASAGDVVVRRYGWYRSMRNPSRWRICRTITTRRFRC